MIIQIIQLSDNIVTCTRFRKKGGSLAPVTGIRLEFSNLSELPGILKDQLYPLQEEIRTILSIPAAMVSLRELHLPITDRRKIRAVLPLELAGDSSEDGPEPACDAILLNTGTQLAGWSERSAVSEPIAMLASIKMEREVVACSPLAWHHLSPPDNQPVALLDNEALVVVDRGNLLFCRIMNTADAVEVERTVAALEVTRSISPKPFYRVDSPPGPDEKSLPLPAELVAMPSNGDLKPAALVPALAIARAYLSGEIFNLRNGTLAWTGAQTHLLKQLRTPLLLCAVVLLLLFVETALRWYFLNREIKALNSSISAIYKGVFPNRTKAVDETGELKSEIRRLQGSGAPGDLLQFLNLLAQSKDDQITGLGEVEYDGELFRIKGDARSNPAVTAMIQKLSAAGLVVDQPDLTGRPDGTTLFVIKGRRKGGKQQ